MHHWIARVVIMILIVLGGCDDLADEESAGVALATLRGTLSLGANVKPPEGNLRVSVLWHDPIFGSLHDGLSIRPEVVDPRMPGGCEDGTLTGWRLESPLLEQSVRVDTTFPSGFSVGLTEPPPAAALYERPDGSATTASGDLVVYEDRNGNGRLDPSTFEAMSPDVVFGSSRGAKPWGVGQRYQYRIDYMSRDSGIEGDGKAGYSLVTLEGTTSGSSWIGVQLLSEGMIDLTLDPTSYAQQMSCTVMCQLDATDVIDDPVAYLKGDLGTEVDWDLGEGASVWSRQDGDRTTLSTAYCTKQDEANGVTSYGLDLAVAITEGCTEALANYIVFHAAPANEPVDLGCTEYVEVDRSAFPVEP